MKDAETTGNPRLDYDLAKTRLDIRNQRSHMQTNTAGRTLWAFTALIVAPLLFPSVAGTAIHGAAIIIGFIGIALTLAWDLRYHEKRRKESEQDLQIMWKAAQAQASPADTPDTAHR